MDLSDQTSFAYQNRIKIVNVLHSLTPNVNGAASLENLLSAYYA